MSKNCINFDESVWTLWCDASWSHASIGGGDTVVIPTTFPNMSLISVLADKPEPLVGIFTGLEEEQELWACRCWEEHPG
jgi:hypothetical protein